MPSGSPGSDILWLIFWSFDPIMLGGRNANADFESLARRVFEVYEERRYEDALEIAEEAARRFPEEAVDTAYWIACLHSRLGDGDRAMETLRDAVRSGVWWSDSQLLSEEDLAPLRGRTEFAEIVKHCRRLKLDAETNSKPDFLYFEPDTTQEILLLTIHGRGSTAKAMADRWKAVTMKLGATLAVPQSTQMFSKGRFCWDDPNRMEKDVVAAHANILSLRRFQHNRTILAGYSQGANIAIYLSLRRVIPAGGFIAVSPGTERSDLNMKRLLDEGAGRELKGWIVAGEQDPRFAQTTQLHEMLVESGVSCEFIVHRDMGHDYPRDFGSALRSALDFILK